MKIAIQGHPTRGKEVIRILESLGGRNTSNWRGNGDISDGFFIDNDGIIRFSNLPKGYKLYTLEEFEKEFPFKIGDKVISLTTGLIGTIIKLEEGGCYYIKYDNGNLACAFRQNLKLYKEMKEERNITLTLDKAKEWYSKGGELREIALQAFTEMELNSLPRSWKDYCKNYPIKPEEIFIDGYSKFIVNNVGDRNPVHDKNICPSRKSAEAHLAMIQLEQLRDCWRQGWKPNWNDDKQTKYCVVYYKGEFKISILCETRHFLSFPTMKMTEEFLKCFRELIELAGDLI